MWQYDVSVIVPVYNEEKYLEQCINSILRQRYNRDKIQIILIDDGSTDNSATICKRYENLYKQITFIEQENKGVSAARNAGIRNAKGKYFMLLDSDDFLSKTCIKNLVNFMENTPEVEIASYTIKNYKNGKVGKHYRNELYEKGTGIYDIEEYPYLSQATINVIIRNEEEHSIFYDETMQVAEDEKFNTNYIMRKRKIGFCKRAVYYYRKIQTSVSNTRNNPFYCFDQIIGYFQYLINTYKNSENKVPRYVQNLILQALKWRIAFDILLPYHLIGEEYEKAVNRIKEILQYIDNETIIEKENMDIYYKSYILKLKGENLNLTQNETKTKGEDQKQTYTISCKGKTIYQSKLTKLTMQRFKIKKDNIYIFGYIDTPISEIIKPELYIEINSEEKKQIPLKSSNMNYYKTTMKTNTFYQFEYEIPIKKVKSFKFYVKVNNNFLLSELEFENMCILNSKLKRFEILIHNNEYVLKYNEKTTICTIEQATSKSKRRVKRKLYKLYLTVNPVANFYRRLAKTNQEIWLYTDRNGVIDNAYYQFKHDITKQDGITRYYLVDDKNNYLSNFTIEELENNVIIRNSFAHKVAFLRSSKILTSFSTLASYSPFKAKTVSYYKDLLQYNVIYLQHGILYAKLLKLYAKEHTEVDKIIISSKFEEENYINHYNYNKEELIASGMPRFDHQKFVPNKKNKILFAPSWRAYLIGDPPINGKRILKEKEFLNSKFYKQINDFLNDKELDNILGEKNITLDFKLHPIFEPYKKYFNQTAKNIKVVDNTIHNEEYKLFITDISSFQFDFARLSTPMIYYLPDAVELRAGLHTYRELDLPLEQGFGDIVYTKEDLVNKVKYYIENDFAIEDKYKQREENFFCPTENCCKKVYDAVKDMN